MKKIVKFILFMLSFCSIFLLVNYLYSPKWSFYQEDKNSMNVLYLGSSFSYCTFDPRIIDDDTIHSYNLASQQQPIQITYYVLKEALKYQTPKVVVLEPWQMSRDLAVPDTEVMFSSLDKMNLNMNKLKAAYSSTVKDGLLEMTFPILRLHSDPKNIISSANMNFKDPLRGYLEYKEAKITNRPNQSILDNKDKAPIPGKNAEYLKKIINLTKKEKIQLLIVKAPLPISEEPQGVLNSVKEIAVENNIPYIDYMNLYDEINFDFATDTLDGWHLNYLGAEKVSRHFKSILEEYLK